MKIAIKNLGAIGKGEVDTSKPLILLCGPNSTGKTYLSYILYAIFSNRSFDTLPCFKNLTEEINEKREFELKFDYLQEFLNAEVSVIKHNIDSIFGISEDDRTRMFKSFMMEMSLDDKTFNQILSHGLTLKTYGPFHDWTIKKEPKSKIIKIEVNDKERHNKFADSIFSEYNLYNILRHCAFYPINRVRMLTVERNSIYTFSKELSISRNELIDRLQNNNLKDSEKMALIDQDSKRYPLAIRDSLRIANDLDNIQKNKSSFFDVAENIEKDLLHGTVGISKTGAAEFIPSSLSRGVRKLQIQMSSSIVKTLTSLIFYLKYLAKKDDLLIIDEPEMNLHPDNQRILARIFSILINKGLRLVISTHSDYIIREFNNMIMAEEISQKYGKDSQEIYSQTELLDKKKVEVLFFSYNNRNKKYDIKPVLLDDYGFNVPTIDNAINEQNKITDTLYEKLRFGND